LAGVPWVSRPWSFPGQIVEMGAMDEKQGYYWEGSAIRLRAGKKEDAGIWLEESTDSEGIRCLEPGISLPVSAKTAEELAEKYGDFNNSEERIMFTIETLPGEVVGGININSIDQKNGTFSTGTRIYRRFRRKGYAREAKLICFRYAFLELRLNKYYSWCIETNENMIRHQLALGCKQEGRVREHIYTDGRYLDAIHFGMTKAEFVERYGATGDRIFEPPENAGTAWNGR
jgi:RimJ/RimL family protein N-acetyltransferase